MVVEMSVKQNWHEHVFPIENRVKELCSEARRLGAWINRLAFPLVDIQIHEHRDSKEWRVILIFPSEDDGLTFMYSLNDTEEFFLDGDTNLPAFSRTPQSRPEILQDIQVPQHLAIPSYGDVSDDDWPNRYTTEFVVMADHVWALLQVLERLEKEWDFEIQAKWKEEQAAETSEVA